MPYVEWRGNKCRVRWDTGRVNPETGKRIYDSKSGFDDDKVAYDYGLDRESDVRNGRYIARRDGALLTGEWAATWLESLDLRYNTVSNYRSHVKKHIEPHWGDKALKDITPHAYQLWTKRLRTQLGEDSVKIVLGTFSMIMEDAVANRLIDASPVPKKSRRGRYVKKAKPKKRDLSMETVYRLALNAHALWGYTGWVCMWSQAFTGMRPAEMYALRREFAHPNWPATDPDSERCRESMERYGGDKPMPAVRVEYQAQYEHGAPKLVAPKYDSHRTLVLPPFLAEMYEQLLKSHDSEWVFPALGGGSLRSTQFSRVYWRPIRDGRDARAGRWAREGTGPVEEMAGQRIYRLRHGAKEWLDEDGHPKVAVETRMGHELPGVEGVYASVTVEMERRIMKSMQKRWERFLRGLSASERAFISQLSPS